LPDLHAAVAQLLGGISKEPPPWRRRPLNRTPREWTQGRKITTQPRAGNDPVFAQPTPTPDPTSFRDPVTDQKLKEIGTVEPFPAPRGGAAEPVLQFADTLGSQGPARIMAIQKAGRLSSTPWATLAAPRGLRRSRWLRTRW
jgi:hypothetical protein